MSPPAPSEPLVDRGIFADLDEQVTLRCPTWLAVGPLLRARFAQASQGWLSVEGVPVCAGDSSLVVAPGHADVVLPAQAAPLVDQDGDGIPDAVDILRGAKKAAANRAVYRSVYREIPYPNGDVPRDEGVCTDVVVRALRNAGFDLQRLLAEDIAAHPGRYPMVKKPDPHIDHRRVRTLLPFFRAHFRPLPTDPRDTAAPYLPGDICFLDTFGDSAPEHVGVVSDRLGRSGLPLLVNNWTDGWHTQEMDLLDRVPVTHRFRVARPLAHAAPADAGLTGLLTRRHIELPDGARQMLLVTAPLWTSSGGHLRRYERVGPDAPWQEVGTALPVRLGSAGLGRGRGLHGGEACSDAPEKQEGDKRAPAGLFSLGTAFGRAPRAPFAPSPWPYRPTTAADRFVDDPKSPHYNTWQIARGAVSWSSAERLTMYSLGLVVDHNTVDPVPGAGSAIFLHPWQAPTHPTVGCTALDEKSLVAVLRWLDPEAHPVLVQVAGSLLASAADGSAE